VHGEIVPVKKYFKSNSEVNGEKAKARRIILGLARIALNYNSWLSAAAFQNTRRILAEAAIKEKIDTLEGIMEVIISGQMPPIGTGHKHYL
jgi:DNA-directed RNA polymerase subunit beta'